MRGPIQEVTSVKTLSREGVETTLSASTYYSTAGKVNVVFDVQPIAHHIEITYKAGYGDNTADVPEALRQGMIAHVAEMFDNRSGASTIPLQSKLLYDGYRVLRIN